MKAIIFSFLLILSNAHSLCPYNAEAVNFSISTWDIDGLRKLLNLNKECSDDIYLEAIMQMEHTFFPTDRCIKGHQLCREQHAVYLVQCDSIVFSLYKKALESNNNQVLNYYSHGLRKLNTMLGRDSLAKNMERLLKTINAVGYQKAEKDDSRHLK
jgi:hypothetical protein